MNNQEEINSSNYKEHIEKRVKFCLDVGKVDANMKEEFFNKPTTSIALVMVTFGLHTELSEITDIIKKKVLYGKPMNLAHLMEEMGDFLYFWDLLLHYIREQSCCDDVNDIMLRHLNEEKLKVRYPEQKFSLERSNNRDTDNEAKVFSNYNLEI